MWHSTIILGQYILVVHTLSAKRLIVYQTPRIDREFAVASCNVIHDAYELSRQQKIRVIVDAKKEADVQVNLRVCSFKEENCNQCEKCFRTMIEIVAEGGNVNDFGFHIEGSFCEALKAFLKIMSRKLIMITLSFGRMLLHECLRITTSYSIKTLQIF